MESKITGLKTPERKVVQNVVLAVGSGLKLPRNAFTHYLPELITHITLYFLLPGQPADIVTQTPQATT